MVRIVVPQKNTLGIVHNAGEGDLVLVIAGKNVPTEVPSSLTLGVFSSVRNERRTILGGTSRPFSEGKPREINTQIIKVEPAYTLMPCETFGETLLKPLFGRVYHPAEFSLYRGSKFIELYFGKEKIKFALSQWDEFQPHWDWIKNLKAPYASI
jgi:hypothetical protein